MIALVQDVIRFEGRRRMVSKNLETVWGEMDWLLESVERVENVRARRE
jgi:hypothetical protein